MAASARVAGAPAGQTLTVVTREIRGAEVDINNDGFGPGDFFLFEERAFDRSGTRVIGRDAVRCEVGIRTFACEGTLLINGKGKIQISGGLFNDNDLTIPVVGGTDRYSGVGGQLTVFDLAGGRSVLVFHLVR